MGANHEWRGTLLGRLLVAVWLVTAILANWHNVAMVGVTWPRVVMSALNAYLVIRLLPFVWRAMRDYRGA